MTIALEKIEWMQLRELCASIIDRYTSDTTSAASHREFEAAVREYGGIINKICLSFSKTISTFDDLRQDALINIWQGYRSFRGESDRRTWIYRVVLNTCVSATRKEKNHNDTLSIADIIEPQDEFRDPAEETEYELLMRMISRLGDIDRSLILLWLEECSYDEISEITGIGRNTIASRLRRAKQKLMDMKS